MKSLERRDAVVMTGDDVEEQIDLDTTRQDMPQDTPQDMPNHLVQNTEPKMSKISRSKRKTEVNDSFDDLILQHIRQNKECHSAELYLRSLVPDLKALNDKTKCFLKASFQKLIFAARFGDLKDVQSLVQSELKCLCSDNAQPSTSDNVASNYQPNTYYNGQTYLNL